MHNHELPAQDSNTEREQNSVPCRLGALLPQLSEKWLSEPTENEIESARILEEREAHLTKERENRRRQDNFRSFIGERKQYEDLYLADWEYPKDDKPSSDRQICVIKAVREFMDSVSVNRIRGVGALFYGPPGTGKDHLATAIIRAACEVGNNAKFVNGIKWFVSLRDAMETATAESDLIRDLTKPDWLVLSDPLPPVWDEKTGTGSLSSYQAQMLYRVIDERKCRNNPTIVTVNVKDGDEAIRRMGGATWDRIKHDSWVFACNWQSFRKPARVV